MKNAFSFYLRMLCVPLIWGASFIPAKIAVHDLTPSVAAFARYVIASITLVIAAYMLEGKLPRPAPKQWVGLALLGATGICLYNLFLFASVSSIPASRTAMIVALSPALIAVGSSFVAREAMGLMRWLGVALALMGAWIVLSRGEVASLQLAFGKGELYMLCGVFCWVSYTLISRKVLSNGLSIIATTTWSSLIGTLMLLPFALYDLPKLSSSATHFSPWFAAALMGLFGTGIAFVWYAQGIKRLGSAHAAVFTNLVPAFAVLSAWLYLKEEINGSLLVGGGVTLIGVFLVNGIAKK